MLLWFTGKTDSRHTKYSHSPLPRIFYIRKLAKFKWIAYPSIVIDKIVSRQNGSFSMTQTSTQHTYQQYGTCSSIFQITAKMTVHCHKQWGLHLQLNLMGNNQNQIFVYIYRQQHKHRTHTQRDTYGKKSESSYESEMEYSILDTNTPTSTTIEIKFKLFYLSLLPLFEKNLHELGPNQTVPDQRRIKQKTESERKLRRRAHINKYYL